MRRIIPEWGKRVKKTLVDRDMTIADLSRKLNLSRSYINNVINGAFTYPDTQRKICDYLDVDIDERTENNMKEGK